MKTHQTSTQYTLSLRSTCSRVMACAAITCLNGLMIGCYAPPHTEEWEPVGVEGSESKATFGTPDDTSRLSYLNRKLAVHAKTSVLISGEIHNVVSSDMSILTAEFDGSLVQVEAKSEGFAKLSAQFLSYDPITMEPVLPTGDFQADDSIVIETAIAQRVELKNLCGEGELTFLTGREGIFLGYELLDSAGEPLSGFGYYPFQAEANQRIILSESQHHELMMLTTLNQPGTINISSQLDATSWNIQLFDEGAIDGAMVHGNRIDLPDDIDLDALLPYTRRFEGNDMYPNTIYAMHIEPTVQGSPLCMADLPVFVESITPDHCYIVPFGIDENYESVNVKSHDENHGLIGVFTEDLLGECKLNVTYPQGNNGQGVTTTITLPVIEPPQPTMGMP